MSAGSHRPRELRLAVASGKGGTGKTTVAVNLAVVLRDAGEGVFLLDGDVEEPNCALFVKPTVGRVETVCLPVPHVEAVRCNGCGACASLCRFGALLSIPGGVLVFTELCHSCGGCARVCPQGAISEQLHEIGRIEFGQAGMMALGWGRLEVGQPRPVPLIRRLLASVPLDRLVIVDAPPGTSCAAVECMRACDCICLVTEPTPFGLHDLDLSVRTARELGVPFGVVVNRCEPGNAQVREYCDRQGIPVLMEMREDRRVAEEYSRGRILAYALPEYRDCFLALAASIRQLAGVAA